MHKELFYLFELSEYDIYQVLTLTLTIVTIMISPILCNHLFCVTVAQKTFLIFNDLLHTSLQNVDTFSLSYMNIPCKLN